MKYFLIALFMLGGLAASSQKENQKFDRTLADSLGSDDYGMKSYVLVILKSGTATVDDKARRDSLFKGHMNNINRLAKDGKLIIAGPLQKNDKNYRGIFVLNVKTVEEARTLVDTDPAVKAGIFEMELFGWYGSAALPMYLPYHEKIEKKTF